MILQHTCSVATWAYMRTINSTLQAYEITLQLLRLQGCKALRQHGPIPDGGITTHPVSRLATWLVLAPTLRLSGSSHLLCPSQPAPAPAASSRSTACCSEVPVVTGACRVLLRFVGGLTAPGTSGAAALMGVVVVVAAAS
eukprot:CAMPEP_0202894804 /NCGR_PEP_ID=MMETSP1392-20130828/4121_1 /ASSEMBLY_ACC=CAM_ASM_000868 /TAXON_ID=225041 /ORGANISM="Chlamydomonas chlamydogama, Strain SAG 11-48b" /LENGTH=139 /DNA_ID=CAMNT_0049579603 /DNA_START=248 /DNA_END=663 /DNA_ORIENTATION=+